MAFERAQLASRLHVPNLDRPVPTRRGQPPPIRTERHAHHRTCVAAQLVQLPAGSGVPEPYRPVRAGGSQPSAIGAERHALDWSSMAPERTQVAFAEAI